MMWKQLKTHDLIIYWYGKVSYDFYVEIHNQMHLREPFPSEKVQ